MFKGYLCINQAVFGCHRHTCVEMYQYWEEKEDSHVLTLMLLLANLTNTK